MTVLLMRLFLDMALYPNNHKLSFSIPEDENLDLQASISKEIYTRWLHRRATDTPIIVIPRAIEHAVRSAIFKSLAGSPDSIFSTIINFVHHIDSLLHGRNEVCNIGNCCVQPLLLIVMLLTS